MSAFFQLLRSRDSHIADPTMFVERSVMAWGLPGETTLQTRSQTQCAIIVLRGDVECTSREGSVRVGGRRWITFDADCALRIRSLRTALAVVVALRPAANQGRPWPTLVPARGRISLRQLRALRSACECLGSNQLTDIGDAQLQLCELLTELRPPARELARCPGRTAMRRLQVYGRLQRARLFIEGHPEEIPRLASLAELTRFSPWYFSKAFTRVFGCNPQHLGKQVRLNHARRLLDSELSISEIAAASGFENSSSFARAFHERFGASASALRGQLAIKHQPA